ncbi:hypothetical protein GCM10009081_22100 [Brevundimonas nasdae]
MDLSGFTIKDQKGSRYPAGHQGGKALDLDSLDIPRISVPEPDGLAFGLAGANQRIDGQQGECCRRIGERICVGVVGGGVESLTNEHAMLHSTDLRQGSGRCE